MLKFIVPLKNYALLIAAIERMVISLEKDKRGVI